MRPRRLARRQEREEAEAEAAQAQPEHGAPPTAATLEAPLPRPTAPEASLPPPPPVPLALPSPQQQPPLGLPPAPPKMEAPKPSVPAPSPMPPPPPQVKLKPSPYLDFLRAGNLPDTWADRRVLVVFSGAKWAATGGGQRPVQLARCWRDMGYEVLFIANKGQGLAVHEGVICGNYADHFPGWLQQLAQWRGDIFCGFPGYYIYTLRKLRHWRMVVDICDDWEEFLKIGALTPDCWSKALVRDAFADAFAVTHSAMALEGFCRRYGARRTVFVPNGSPAEPVALRRLPADMRLGKGLNVAHCGVMWGRWIDNAATQQLAQELEQRIPGSMVHVIGGFSNNPADPVPKPDEANIIHYGERPYAEALQYLAACDVGIIPFRNKVLSKSVWPNKWGDYIAARLPVVATDILEPIKGLPYTYLVAPDKMAEAVVLAAAQGRIPEAEARALTARHCWAARAAQIDDLWREAAAVPPRKVWRREGVHE